MGVLRRSSVGRPRRATAAGIALRQKVWDRSARTSKGRLNGLRVPDGTLNLVSWRRSVGRPDIDRQGRSFTTFTPSAISRTSRRRRRPRAVCSLSAVAGSTARARLRRPRAPARAALGRPGRGPLRATCGTLTVDAVRALAETGRESTRWRGVDGVTSQILKTATPPSARSSATRRPPRS